MFTALGALYGALLSVMNLWNAQLSGVYGDAGAAVMIHAVGLITLLPTLWPFGRPKGRAPWQDYLGGVIGVATVVCCSLGVRGIGVTGNLVLMLLGQLLCAAGLDQWGLMGARRYPMNAKRAGSLLLIACGGLVMLLWNGAGTALGDVPAWAAALASVAAGFAMVFARLCNARLSRKAGLGYSTVMNYVTGLLASGLLFLASGGRLAAAFPAPVPSVTAYLGGMLGALAIFLCNVITPRLSNLRFTITLFVGQLCAGMLLDALAGSFAPGTLAGALLAALGMALNLQAEGKGGKNHGDPAQP